jgi:hypothetical protein
MIDKLQRHGQVRGRVRDDISIYLYQNSPISNRKADTALYRVANSADFREMALNNQFSAANYEYVVSRPLREFSPLVSIGEITVYSHVNNGTFYVVEGVKSNIRYTTLPNDIKAFRRVYYYLYDALLSHRLFYASAPAKIHFERLWS